MQTNRLMILGLSFVVSLDCGSGSGGPVDAASVTDAFVAPDAGPPDSTGPLELVLRGRFVMDPAGDIAAHATRPFVAVSAWYTGDVLLIDVSDPTAPTIAARISNIGYTSDVQIKGDLLYINHEPFGNTRSDGIDIYDVSDETNPFEVARVDDTAGDQGMRACHNSWPQPDRALLYCASSETGEVVVLSMGATGAGTPTAPVVVSTIASANGSGVHDMFARGNRLYIAFLSDGFSIYDITDPASPIELATHNYTGSFNHNVWPSEDDQYLFTTDENLGGHVRVFDIGDLNNISEVADYQPVPDAIVHNIEVAGTLGYIAHYTAGLRVIDVTDPTTPFEVAVHDFYTGPDVTNMEVSTGFHGAWGVEPKFPFVYVSGIESGLWIYELVPR